MSNGDSKVCTAASCWSFSDTMREYLLRDSLAAIIEPYGMKDSSSWPIKYRP